MGSGVFESSLYQCTYVGLFVSSDGFDIYGYPVFLDVIRDIFVDVDVFIVFYGMEIHIYSYHSYDHFHQHSFHSNLYGYWCAYGFRRALILYISIDVFIVKDIIIGLFPVCSLILLSPLSFLSPLVSLSFGLWMLASFWVFGCVFIPLMSIR